MKRILAAVNPSPKGGRLTMVVALFSKASVCGSIPQRRLAWNPGNNGWSAGPIPASLGAFYDAYPFSYGEKVDGNNTATQDGGASSNIVKEG